MADADDMITIEFFAIERPDEQWVAIAKGPDGQVQSQPFATKDEALAECERIKGILMKVRAKYMQ